MTSPRIAAVFACYNRRSTALECVRRLQVQTRPPDLVVVGDNASTDGTPDALRELAWGPLTVVDTGDNLGNAGGVRVAMDHAFALGADAVWILDDDSWPREAALEALLAGGFDPQRVRHSLQIDPAGGRYSWPLPIREASGKWHTIRHPGEWPGGERAESRASWTGAMIPRAAWEKAGPVLGELFIRGEDEEYPRRLAAAGFRFEAVRDSILDHPSAKNLRRWVIGGKEFWFETGLEDWKFYYEVRNTMWLMEREGSMFKAWAIALLHGWATLLHDGWSPSRFATWRAAVSDAKAGRLGRRDALKQL
ncbi:glycosyltransferase [Luteolibacter luteus]|uniref:Glycosyltransferase n=1 Tax=Luteolibacter luteus TaxID=2728835 RepID=A0A858RIE9_9BACT|nr:glycosyltransferase [Luteolibacter luteus]QJE96986.1 glycosyltransferase [Luteolibacter luteus]